MKTAINTLLSAIIILVCCVVCLGSFTSILAGFWLYTYKVFTAKTPVAEVVISEVKNDDAGSYADVELTQLTSRSALSNLFNSAPIASFTEEKSSHYKVYGDSIYVGGPIVKFKDELMLINFRTVYKLGKLYGRYDLDNEQETTKPTEAQEQSSYDLNGGYGEWKTVFDHYTSADLFGQFLRTFIASTQISTAGVFVQNHSQRYLVFITTTGFLWEVQ